MEIGKDQSPVGENWINAFLASNRNAAENTSALPQPQKCRFTLPARAGALALLAPRLQTAAKIFTHADVKKALQNEPFGDFSRIIAAWKANEEQQEQHHTLHHKIFESFLRHAFPLFTETPGISFQIQNYDSQAEKDVIGAVADRFLKANLLGARNSFCQMYDGFSRLRQAFQAIHTIRGLTIETLVPIRHLPELLVAAPIWFVNERNGQERAREPQQNKKVTYFCDRIQGDRFRWLYQLYNREPLSLSNFQGRDIIPPRVLETIEKTQALFDFLVIATPYHDIASKKWDAAGWVRNVDPFLFGFNQHTPDYMYFLDRWSGNGIFPMIGEMIADTVAHLQTNLAIFDKIPGYLAWYQGPQTHEHTLSQSQRGFRHELKSFVCDFITAYKADRLFPWLRNEVS
jgi:hypothetical protein